MSIVANCPNGHVLKVKNEFAGKSGLCPHCGSRVIVPMPVHEGEKARISDDEIMGLLGPPDQVKPQPPPPVAQEDLAIHESIHDPTPVDSQSGISLAGSSMLRQQKVCPQCGHLASFAFTHCSRCGTPLPKSEHQKK